jgi:hypothetical protein
VKSVERPFALIPISTNRIGHSRFASLRYDLEPHVALSCLADRVRDLVVESILASEVWIRFVHDLGVFDRRRRPRSLAVLRLFVISMVVIGPVSLAIGSNSTDSP